MKYLVVILLFIANTVVAQVDTLSFLHITDLHVIFNQSGYDQALMESRKLKQYDQGETRLRAFFETIPEKTQTNMVIATGDLVDFFEADAPDGRFIALQAEQFATLLDDYHIPVFLTLGNHDIFSFDWQVDKLKHNQNSAERSWAAWIRNFSCFRNGTYYSELYKVGKTEYRFVFLNNGFYRFSADDNTNVPYIDKSQEYWLKDQLNKSETDVEIIFMHIPFKKDAVADNSGELFSLLTNTPSVKLIFSGHNHKNAIDSYSGTSQVQTGALVQNADNWRMVRLTENSIVVSNPGNSETELLIPVNDIR
jgi:2',3'-cyclic-nucleotide 2'-phosphodiesterase (5'-nucleotidase family)